MCNFDLMANKKKGGRKRKYEEVFKAPEEMTLEKALKKILNTPKPKKK